MKNSDNLIHSFNHTDHTEGNYKGLTKREFFAGLAMQGICGHVSLGLKDSKTIAGYAIECADELLKQLEA